MMMLLDSDDNKNDDVDQLTDTRYYLDRSQAFLNFRDEVDVTVFMELSYGAKRIVQRLGSRWQPLRASQRCHSSTNRLEAL